MKVLMTIILLFIIFEGWFTFCQDKMSRSGNYLLTKCPNIKK